MLQLARHKRGKRHLRGGWRQAFDSPTPSRQPSSHARFLLPVQRGVDSVTDSRFLSRSSGRPRVFTVRFQRTRGKYATPPAGNSGCARVASGWINPPARRADEGDKNHAAGINGVNVFDRFLIHPVERSNVVVELVRRFVDQVKAQQRRALTKIVRHGNPPVNHLFSVSAFGSFYIHRPDKR